MERDGIHLNVVSNNILTENFISHVNELIKSKPNRKTIKRTLSSTLSV